jgi:hypothetical protein
MPIQYNGKFMKLKPKFIFLKAVQLKPNLWHKLAYKHKLKAKNLFTTLFDEVTI